MLLIQRNTKKIMNIDKEMNVEKNNKEKTVIYIVRHGQSVGNLFGRCLGHTDLDITELGYEQAKMTAKALENVEFAAIYSSDLIRAVHTAEPHAQKHNLKIFTSENLRELYFGTWENAETAMLREKCYDEFEIGWRQNFGTFTAPEGESVVNMAERMHSELCKIAAKHSGKNILVVSHAAAIRALWGKISGLEPDKWAEACFFPTNASYSVVEIESGNIRPISYSNDSHLGEFVTFIKR